MDQPASSYFAVMGAVVTLNPALRTWELQQGLHHVALIHQPDTADSQDFEHPSLTFNTWLSDLKIPQ
ncbi:hypothetical protein TNCV_3717811 [Trichonephila clavipes]|nr:hypothetical protein TNCV_3717811 [Trichonephila clavipes]